MDKAEFIDVAPRYYATAILVYLQQRSESVSEQKLSEYYSARTSEAERVSYLDRFRLFDIAVAFLRKDGLIETVHDAFGPTLIKRASDFTNKYNALSQDTNFPLYKYRLANSGIESGMEWLRMALRELDRTYDAGII
jgi:hypothetical protein